MAKIEWMVAVVVVGAVLLVGVAIARYAIRRIVAALRHALEQAPIAQTARTDLPREIFALARRLGACDDRPVRLVHLTQRGEMWFKPGAKALRFTARQIIAVTGVGFLWRAQFWLRGVSMQIVDYLVDGEGGLRGWLFGVFPVLDLTGGESMFRGEAMRYLVEATLWAADAILLNPELDWRVIDGSTLAVATGPGSRRCEVRLMLDEAGDPIRFEADDRPRQDRGEIIPTPWFGRCSHYQTFQGRRIPTTAEVGWILDGVEFVYWRGRIESWSLEV